MHLLEFSEGTSGFEGQAEESERGKNTFQRRFPPSNCCTMTYTSPSHSAQTRSSNYPPFPYANTEVVASVIFDSWLFRLCWGKIRHLYEDQNLPLACLGPLYKMGRSKARPLFLGKNWTNWEAVIQWTEFGVFYNSNEGVHNEWKIYAYQQREIELNFAILPINAVNSEFAALWLFYAAQ